MADLASFWAGSTLGPIEIASARSFLRHGDRLTIYAPGPIGNLPEGLIWRNADEIMPSDRIVLHKQTGSPALHTDLFRYALMNRTDQVWVDLDVIALRPLDFPSPWVFGHETAEQVNGAVLRLPRHSASLKALSAFRPDTVGFPPHVGGFRRLKYWVRTGGRGLPIDRWPWGSIGPRALTHFLRATGEIRHAMPASAFYAVSLSDVGRFVEPGALTRDSLPPDAWAVHLWGSALRRVVRERHGGSIPAGSFLSEALEGAIR